MSRKLFLLVGPTDDRVVHEALKPAHGFDRVIGVCPSRVAARTFRVDYFGTSDGVFRESKEDEHRGLLSDWVASSVEAEDVVFARIQDNYIDELMASDQLAKVDFLFLHNARENVVQYASNHKVSLIQGLDVARWLHEYNKQPSKALDTKVMYAEYGTEIHSADVTQALIANLSRVQGQAQVSNALCGCDPHFGVGKMLSVHVEVDGVFKIVQASEGSYLSLS
jgi:hypothetical protein